MSDNNFHLAAALLADAADLVTTRPWEPHRPTDHAYGHCQLAATHTVEHDGTHTLTLWAVDDDSLLAAVEAHQQADAATPTTRIVAFRAEGHIFTAQHDWTFTAAGDHTYALAARVGDDHWDLTIDGHTTVHLDTIDAAVAELVRHHHDALARLTPGRAAGYPNPAARADHRLSGASAPVVGSRRSSDTAQHGALTTASDAQCRTTHRVPRPHPSRRAPLRASATDRSRRSNRPARPRRIGRRPPPRPRRPIRSMFSRCDPPVR